MNKYRVAYTYIKYGEEMIEADSIEEAKEKFDEQGYDAELFFIEDTNGDQVFFD